MCDARYVGSSPLGNNARGRGRLGPGAATGLRLVVSNLSPVDGTGGFGGPPMLVFGNEIAGTARVDPLLPDPVDSARSKCTALLFCCCEKKDTGD